MFCFIYFYERTYEDAILFQNHRRSQVDGPGDLRHKGADIRVQT